MHRSNSKVADIDRKRLIEHFRATGRYLDLAATLNINRSTALSIIKSDRIAKRVSTGAPRKLMENDVERILLHLEQFPTATLNEIKTLLGLHVSISTISNHLDGRLITRKMLRYEPASRNLPENIEKRKEFAHFYQRVCCLKIHIDETNFNLLTTRRFGRCRRGERVSLQVRASPGANLNVLLAISDNGDLVKVGRVMGSAKDYFKVFMSELSAQLGNTECVIFMDNAPIHKKKENFENVNQKHIIRHFDAPYSPQLNPCEQAFSVLKASIKGFISVTQPRTDRVTADGDNTSMVRYRERLLHEGLNKALLELTSPKIRQFYRHCDRVIADCSLGRELEN